MLLFIGRLDVLACNNLEALDDFLPPMRKESKMPVLSPQKNREAVTAKRAKVPFSEGVGNKAQDGIGPPVAQNIPSLLRVHERKVLAVRQQLVEGRYDFEERLDTAVDRLIETVTE